MKIKASGNGISNLSIASSGHNRYKANTAVLWIYCHAKQTDFIDEFKKNLLNIYP